VHLFLIENYYIELKKKINEITEAEK